MKKLLLLVMLVCLCAGMASAVDPSVWTRPTVDGPGNWNDSNNWNDGGVPDPTTTVVRTATNPDNLAEIVVDDAQTFGRALRHGYYEDGSGVNSSGTTGPLLRIRNGGSLSSGLDVTRSYVGYWSDAQMIVEAGGVFSTSHRLYIGYKPGAIGTVDIAGTVNVTSNKILIGDDGTGFLNVLDGGVLNVRNYLSIPINSSSFLDIQGTGKVSAAGNFLTDAEALIAGGRIKGDGVAGGVIATYADDVTTITVIPEPATMILLGLGGLLIKKRR